MPKETKRWMPMFWGDYFRGTQQFNNATEHGAYLLLLAYCWNNEKLPKDDTTRRRIAKCTPRQWALVRDIVSSKFDDEGRNERCSEELAYAVEKSRIASANAQRRHSKTAANGMLPTPTPTGKERKKEIHSGNGGGKRGKPRHGQKTKDGHRIWLDRGTSEWNAYAEAYAGRHAGMAPPTQWNGSGTWFNLATGDA